MFCTTHVTPTATNIISWYLSWVFCSGKYPVLAAVRNQRQGGETGVLPLGDHEFWSILLKSGKLLK